ncbi:MAG: glycosyltransferase family 4 protein [Chloroflexi bacterium]|nr:glycosyltransferase family 4 protein [Chloroflexota bacterium]
MDTPAEALGHGAAAIRLAMLTFYPADPAYIPGGIRMVAYNLVNALRAFPDLELHVFHCHSDIDRDRIVCDERLTVHYLALPRRRLVPNLVSGVRRLVRALRALKPNLVHAHAAHFAYAGKMAGYPTVYTIHGILPYEREIYNRTLFDRLRYGLLDYYERRALQRVDALVAISPYVREAYESLGRLTAARVGSRWHAPEWVRIDNPVPDDFFALPDRTEPWRVLYVGSITEVKDLLTLLRAIGRVRDVCFKVRLRLAGRATSDEYARQVRAYVGQSRLEGNVCFLGLLDRQQLLDEYSRAAVVALPSLRENAPMALIEAMASARPVVATAVGGVPYLVREGETGFLVPAQDDEALADRLLALLLDPAQARRMGERGREVARQRFAAERVASEYYALYKRLLMTHDVTAQARAQGER